MNRIDPKKYSIIIIIAASCLLPVVGCVDKNNNKETSDSLWVRPQEKQELLAFDAKEVKDTITINGRLLTYVFHFTPSDSLPLVINADGQKYKDNIVKLTVKADSNIIFNKTFYKNDFKDYVDPKNFRTSALAGFNYNLTKMDDHHALHFIATIGDPDETSGVNFPIDICITTDGRYTMEKANDIETEPLLPGLNKEPLE